MTRPLIQRPAHTLRRRSLRRRTLGGKVCTALALSGLWACDSASADERPNFLFLISDDQSYQTLGSAGHAWIETPNIDRLAARGVRFTNAFVTTSLCSPARASFLTSRYARSHGILGNSEPLGSELESFASILSEAGYDSAYFGKWHMGRQPSPLPGFRHAKSFVGQGRYQDCPFWIDGQRTPTQGYVDDVTSDFAIEFLEREQRQPFLVCVGFKAPHGPRHPAQRFEKLYADVSLPAPLNVGALPPFPRRDEWRELARQAGVPMPEYDPPGDWARGVQREPHPSAAGSVMTESLRKYYRLLAGVDHNVGRLLDTLEKLDLDSNTIVIYVSDNGYFHGEHGLDTKRAAYEESMRIVFLIRDPSQAAQGARGRTPQEMVLNLDLAPTLLDYAGVEIPSGMQGRSLRPLLEGEAASWRSDFLYEYYREGAFPVPTLLALRSTTRKLVVYPGYPEWTELYDLERDPLELRNLAAEESWAEERRRLKARFDGLEAELGPRPRRR